MAWFRNKGGSKRPVGDRKVDMPEGLWTKCNHCGEFIYRKEVARNANVCPKCNYHFRISARERLELLCDDGAWEELDAQIEPVDALGFVDTKPYAKRLREYQKRTGRKDAVVTVESTIDGVPAIVVVMEYGFMGGSMGSVVGEKITRAIERALASQRPLVIVASSGGARMQEGALSLMQMAKISGALARLAAARLPFISVLTDPTTGGVTASFAMLGDLNIAEPRALIGFAGPRVIEQSIREKLPEGFQRSEFLLEHGMLDLVVPRSELKETLSRAIRYLLPADLLAATVSGAYSEIPTDQPEADDSDPQTR
jgi:acetyl-CoA carboxylase carboxyl transferase subunit beta